MPLPQHVQRRALVPLLALVVGVGITAVTVALGTRSGSPEGLAALDSAAAVVGVLLAYVLLGRFWESRHFRDLFLSGFLLLLGCSNAAFSVMPRVVGAEPSPGAAAVAGLLAGGLFVAATWLPTWHWPGSPVVAVGAMGVAVAGAIALAGGVAISGDGAGSVDTFGTTGDVGLTVAQSVAAGLFALGACGALRSIQDPLLLWLAAAGLLGALSRANFALATASEDEWATAGNLCRLGFYVTLFLAAGVEIRSYWHRVAQVAALEERRHLARDLHDGLAQELAVAVSHSRALAERSEYPARANLVAAATERALDESRRAIAALTRPLDEPLEVALAQCAEELCDRHQARLDLDAQPGLLVTPDLREALLRITREAVTNAVRHGAAGSITVRLRGPDPLSLTVEDDGVGFDESDPRHLSGRIGVVSMRERAEALGGTFCLVSRYDGGTTVEVTLP